MKNRRCHIGPGDSDVIDVLFLVAPKGKDIFSFNSHLLSGTASSAVYSVHVLSSSNVHHAKQNSVSFSNCFWVSSSTNDFLFLVLDSTPQGHGSSHFFSSHGLIIFNSAYLAVLLPLVLTTDLLWVKPLFLTVRTVSIQGQIKSIINWSSFPNSAFRTTHNII